MKQHPLKFPAILFILSIIGITSTLHAQPTGSMLSILPADRVTPFTARINGEVTASGPDTVVEFHWGKDSEWTQDDAPPNISPAVPDPITPTTVRANLFDLEPGTTYRYRTVAGIEASDFATFRTLATPVAEFLSTTRGLSLVPPVLEPVPLEPASEEDISDDITIHSTTTVEVAGRVNPGGGAVNISFEYGKINDDGTTNYSLSAIPIPQDVSGVTPEDFKAILTGLKEGESYRVRIRAQGLGGTAFSDVRTFEIVSVSKLSQTKPRDQPTIRHSLRVHIVGTEEGMWRTQGSSKWNKTGELGQNLIAGKRDIEFKPVAGFIQPVTVFDLDIGNMNELRLDSSSETLTLKSEYSRYFSTPTEGGGSISITIKPDSIAIDDQIENRAQWRFVEETKDTDWKNSGDTVENLLKGKYEVVFKRLDGYEKVPSMTITVDNTGNVSRTATYIQPTRFESQPRQPIPVMDENGLPTNTDLPFAYLGEIRSEAGRGTGFVVDDRVVATASHVVFDDINFKFVNEIQWLFQRIAPNNSSGFFPAPKKPRGFYAASGYAEARRDAREKDPDNYFGNGTSESQNLDFAVMWFSKESAGRGGYSGWLASDKEPNEFLNSNKPKILAGFPVGGGFDDFVFGLYHKVEFSDPLLPASGHTWKTTAAQGYSGMSGGPLFVEHLAEDGSLRYFPAAIYLGGSGQTIVRAINSDVVRLFRLASDSGDSGEQNSGNTGRSVTGGETNKRNIMPRAIQVLIEPSDAIDRGRWALHPDIPIRKHREKENNRTPGLYELVFSHDGFPAQGVQHVELPAGTDPDVPFVYTFTYLTQGQLDQMRGWRNENFGTEENAGDAAHGSDPDKDGDTNIEEFRVGTDPNNSGDFFIQIPDITRSGSETSITFDAKAERIYTLQSSIDLKTWGDEGEPLGPFATNDKKTFTVPLPPANTFYRIKGTLARP